MVSLEDLIAAGRWTGEADQIEALRQAARDWNWEDDDGGVSDPEEAAGAILDALRASIREDPPEGLDEEAEDPIDPGAAARLFAALALSAARHSAAREAS